MSNQINKLKILGISGSIRTGSYNTAILNNIKRIAKEKRELEIEIFDIKNIPVFNPDDEKIPPQIVIEFKNKIRESDAIIFVSPEYNYSVPGVLKNAIDWATRPYGDNSFEGKAAAIVGASPGMIGTARMQYQLRQIMVFCNMHPINKPEMMINNVHEKIDKEGNLKDTKTEEKIIEMIDSLVNWTVQLKK